MQIAWRLAKCVLHDYYPPRIFLFSPLYRYLRRKLGLPMAISNFLVWFASSLLHSLPFWLSGRVWPGVFFFGVFLGLGCLSTLALISTKRTLGTVLPALRHKTDGTIN